MSGPTRASRTSSSRRGAAAKDKNRKELSGERVASAVRKRIQAGELLPGQQIHQEAWSEQLQVSRATLRDGLRILTTQNYLEYDTNRGYFVKRFAFPEVSELYELRKWLERRVLESMEPASAETVSLLKELASQVGDSAMSADFVGVMESEKAFYFTIYDLSPHKFLVAEARRLYEMADPYRLGMYRLQWLAKDPRVREVTKAHLEMAEAVRERDPHTLLRIIEEGRAMVVAEYAGKEGFQFA
jgi:DNA-binding GntR family transcriptional regulator